jgi:hypothetical protein
VAQNFCGYGGYGGYGSQCNEPATIELTPRSATNPVGTQQCVTATVRDIVGNPVSSVSVRFDVSGTGIGGTQVTDANGQTTFCYTGPATPRTDTITASVTQAATGPYLANPPNCPPEGLSYSFGFAYENGEHLFASPTVSCAGAPDTKTATSPSGQVQSVTVSQSSTTSGTSTTVGISTTLSKTDTTKASPPTELDIGLPADLVRNYASFPTCDLTSLLTRGPNGCPRDSRVGVGTLSEDVRPILTFPVHGRVTIFNAANGGLLLFVLPELGPTFVIDGHPDTNGTLIFAVPPILTLPGVPDATITQFNLTLGGTGSSGVAPTDSVTKTWVAPPTTSLNSGPTGTVSTNTPTFTFSSSDPGVTFECSIDGGAFFPCSSPYTTPRLGPGDHTFTVRARNAAGIAGAPVTRSFRVANVTALAQPVLGKTVNVAPVSGVVLVRLRGQKKFTRLTAGKQVPVGSTVDATRGVVRLTSAGKTKGTTQAANFYQGIFVIAQSAKTGVTDLSLTGGSFAACPSGRARRSAALGSRRKKHSASSTVRKLWGDGSGKFQTTGRYSSAAVRGTIWLVADRCDATLTKVRRGSVTVRDFVRKRTVIVKAPGSYLARKR